MRKTVVSKEIMSKFQKPISISDSGEKWMLMEKIYELEK